MASNNLLHTENYSLRSKFSGEQGVSEVAWTKRVEKAPPFSTLRCRGPAEQARVVA